MVPALNPIVQHNPVHGAAARLRSERVRNFNNYWRSIQNGRDVPLRADLNPAHIKSLLPYMILSDVTHDPLRIRFRLAGSVVTDAFGYNIAGQWLDQVSLNAGLEFWQAQYQRMVDDREPVFGAALAVVDDRMTWRFEWGLFPLSTTGGVVDQCVEIEDCGLRQMTASQIERAAWRYEVY